MNFALGLELALSTRPQFGSFPERDITKAGDLFYRFGLQPIDEAEPDRKDIDSTTIPI